MVKSKDKAAYNLFKDPKYKMPRKLPNGKYTATPQDPCKPRGPPTRPVIDPPTVDDDEIEPTTVDDDEIEPTTVDDDEIDPPTEPQPRPQEGEGLTWE